MNGMSLVVEYVNGDAHWSTKPNLARFAESSPKSSGAKHGSKDILRT